MQEHTLRRRRTQGDRYLFDADDVIAWLDEQAIDFIAGYTRSSTSCPLATYVWKRHWRTAVIHPGAYSIEIRGRFLDDRDLPHWAAVFIELIDRLPFTDVPAFYAIGYVALARARTEFATPDA